MHLLTIVLLTVWASCAQGQGGTCDFPKIKHGSIYNENRYEHVFPVAVGKYVYYSCEQSFASPKQSVWTRIECTAEGWSPDPQCLSMAGHRGPFQSSETETTGAGSIPNIERRETENRNAEDWRELDFLLGEFARGIAGHRGPFQSSETETIGAGSIPNIERRETENRNAEGRWELPFPLHQFNTEFCYRPTFENARTQSRRKRFKVNDHLEYDCHPGYENKHGNTSGTIVCGDSGFSDTPTCFGIVNMHLLTIVLLTVWASCAQGQGETCDFPKIKHGSIYNENRYKQQFPVAIGKSVYYSCEQSFASPEQSVWTQIECTAEGWSPAPQCLRHCVLPSVEHGHSDYSQVTHLEGETVKITCDTGYSLPNNQRNITCTERDWSTEPICIPYQVTCSPPYIQNGIIRPEKPIYTGDELVTYECKNNFYPATRETTVKCTIAGWVPPPRCAIKPCDFPNIPHGALHEESRHKPYFPVPIGKQFYYHCHENFATPSDRTWDYIKCTITGWKPEVPCRRKCLFSYLENGKWTWRTKAYYQGESVIPECNDGFGLPNGEKVMTCTEDGWSPPPKCVRINSVGNCGPPPSVENGDTTSYQVGEYAPESKVDYQCQAHYVLEGDRTIVCRNGQWSEPPRCLTPCVISEDLLNEHNLVFRWTGERKLYLKSGDTVEFDCKRGYRRKPYESFRKICEKGKVIYPTCV